MSISINRCLVQVRPTEKYFEWGNSHEDAEDSYVTEKESWGNAYLIKEIESGTRDEVRKKLSSGYWKRIAEEEFSGWWNNPDIWPPLKTIKDFEIYFDWTHTELIFDLEKFEIIKEEF